MKNFLGITIVGSVLVVGLAAFAANRSLRLFPSHAAAAPAQPECGCKNLKTLQIELRNATRLQQAFSNKIAELRTMNGDSAQVALKVFAQGEARRGLEPIPDYKGPSEFDYSPWGENQRTFNFPTEQLCGMSDSAKVNFDQAVAASGCDGIGKALRAHEDVHGNMCRSIGYKAYLGMHGADRAREEAEAYGAQIAVLQAEIAKLLDKNCEPYKASGKAGDTVVSGDICNLGKKFRLKTNNPFVPSFEFVPSSPTEGTWSFSTGNGLSASCACKYTITGTDTLKTGIELTGSSTGTLRGTTASGGGSMHIDLVPLDTECKP